MRAPSEAAKLSGKLGSARRGKTFPPMSEAQRAKISASRLAWSERCAVGHRVTPSGYVEFTKGPHKGRSQHVVLMEERLGRSLMADEVVHHIDGNRTNNEPNNLALMTRSAHTRLHRREKRLAKGTM